ncbi:50S ribosomal protein L23 [Candidatus Nomurabacteria bacterium]|nr:50S ribosomal protein L23 [Candidatus Nomurabacteria bacterium]
MSKIGHKINQDVLTLVRPIVTEKAAATGVHVFAVAADANKPLIRAALKKLYQVTPRRINIMNVQGKKVMMRGKVGQKPGLKKAIVYLKPGETITLA